MVSGKEAGRVLTRLSASALISFCAYQLPPSAEQSYLSATESANQNRTQRRERLMAKLSRDPGKGQSRPYLFLHSGATLRKPLSCSVTQFLQL